ncbi:MAG: hypothetical protein Q4B77_06440 [Coriobacteriaceae bacterium]|nr:hypothetical protein [Coriobacteriaceae bacterium]
MDIKRFNFKDMSRRAKVALVGFIAAVVIAFVAAFGLFAGANGPSRAIMDQVIESEVADTLPSAGVYDAEGTWEITSVKIISKERHAVEGMLASQFGDAYYAVAAQVKASNGSAEVERSISCDFVKYEGTWQLVSSPRTESETWHALAGPDKKKLMEHAGDALRMVDSAKRTNELQMLYKDCKASVEDLTFDEEKQTASAQLVFKRENAFSTAGATIDVDFEFGNGQWGIKSAKANGDAAKLSYDKLVGTWRGAFQSTAADDGNCFGAQNAELVLKIASVDSESGKVEGTFQGLAHNHAYLDDDANGCEGDSDTGEIAFVATLNESEVIGKNYEGMLTMTIGTGFTAPETAHGKVRISFGFGTREDENAAVAKLTTQANIKKGYRSSSMFEDTYTLTKEK